MLDLSKYTPAIEIKIDEPGVYLFPNSSSEGKTYLCSMLKELSPYERVDSLTFSEIVTTDTAVLFDNDRIDLLMLDRYDMYRGMFLDEIKRFATAGIVLVDCKTYQMPMHVKSCGIYLYADKLVVM